MKQQNYWNGVLPAVTTKFSQDQSLDIPTFLHGARAQMAAGARGIIIGGSLGENSTITQFEKLELLDATLEALPGTPVLINIAEGSTAKAIELANLAEEHGASGIMVLPPMMYRPTETETVRFFTSIASHCGLPVLIYNNPVDYKVEVTLSMFEKLLKLDTIQAVKESTRDLANVTRLRNQFGERLKILTGVDTIAIEALIMGADGWVAGLVNAFPNETIAIFSLVKAGRIDEAIAIHRWFLPLLELDISPLLVQYIKLAESMTGLGTEYVREPRLPLEKEHYAETRNIIERALQNRPVLPNM